MKRRLAFFVLLASCSDVRGHVLRVRDEAVGPDGSVAPGDAGPDADSPDGANDGSSDGDGGLERIGTCRIEHDLGFLDQFDGPTLDAANWLVAHGNTPIEGERSQGGLLRDNVRIEENKLVLTVHGDLYTGPLRGIAADGSPRPNGTRTGAAIATRDLFMSATFQWEGRLVGPPGVKMVLVAQRNDPAEGYIAYVAPGLDGTARSYAFAEAIAAGPLGATLREQIAMPEPLDNGENHALRFDWHSGVNPDFAPSVDFWMDGDNLAPLRGNAPARAGRLWLVAFVPENEPADFDTAEVLIETAFITTLGEVNDRCTDGELATGILEEP